jgi:hypothetical protein
VQDPKTFPLLTQSGEAAATGFFAQILRNPRNLATNDCHRNIALTCPGYGVHSGTKPETSLRLTGVKVKRVPNIHGLIRRRLLVNYRVDPAVIQRQLPSRFRPKLHDGYAIAGICLIRLENIRPKLVPKPFGISSENAAHRVAVTWEDETGSHEGVYVPRRDTASLINRLAGGRLFPGEHHRAKFQVRERDNHIDLRVRSADRLINVELSATLSADIGAGSCFKSIAEASAFFECGSVGYSATSDKRKLDGMVLKTYEWKVEPLTVERVYSSYFTDTSIFPAGSASFDCALIMRNIRHEWHAADDLYL